MSSIAYVSDEKMLDYHRVNANSSMNFWRLSLRNFERFTIGDLLFFIDKRNPHPITKEKGIIGFGRASQMRTMSVKRMWDQFDTRNGYQDLDSFKNAILAYGSEVELPRQIQSIYLEEVTFFKSPVYLSEIDVHISKRLESFTYLTYKHSIEIINRGMALGLDPWVEVMNPQNLDKSKIIEEQKIRESLEGIAINWTHAQIKMTTQLRVDLKVGCISYELSENGTSIYIPVSSIKNQFFELVGVVSYLRSKLGELRYVFYSKNDFEGYESSLSDLNIEHECI